jgi:hypothetical protein
MTIRSIAALLLLGGCTSTLTAVPAGSEFELSPGATVELAGTGVVLTMLDVANDSRCPIDVVCITAGDAEVRFRVRGEGSESTVSLHTMQEPRAVTVGAVRVELVDLAPPNHAGAPPPPASYRARVRWSTP